MKKTICMILVLALLTCMMPLTVWAEEIATPTGAGSNYPVIKPDKVNTVEITTRGEYVYFSYTPAYTESYTFYSTGNHDTVCGYIYDSDMNKLAHSTAGNFSIVYTLEANVTYILATTFYRIGTTGSYDVVLQTNHAADGVVTTPATCTEDGVMAYNCTICAAEYTEAIPAGHSWDEQYHCTVCGKYFYESGACGETLTWTLNSEGVLTISGAGAMTDYDSSVRAPWYQFRDQIKTVNVGSGVTAIGKNAFYQCINLTDVTIPDSVASLGFGAFDDCASLTSVAIPSGMTQIPGYRFDGCIHLTNVSIPHSVTTIDSSAFQDSPYLDKVYYDGTAEDWANVSNASAEVESATIIFGQGSAPSEPEIHESGTCGENLTWTLENGVLTISGEGAMTSYETYYDEDIPWFQYRNSITSIEIEYGVTSIGNAAFEECRYVTQVSIPSSVTSIGYDAFRDCVRLISVTIPSSITSIGSGVFSGCVRLASVTIPSSVTSIGYDAFENCYGLTSINIPSSVTSIGDSAFINCIGLTSVTLQEGLHHIESAAFNGCTGLTSITIPGSVSTIGRYAFSGCTGLTSLTIEFGTYTTIGSGAFLRCTSLTNITMPNSISTIGSAAFAGCTSLTSITVPGTVSSIGGEAFDGCTSLSHVMIGDGVTSIEEEAFRDCTSLTRVTIPGSVTSIGEDVFFGCTSLNQVYFLCKAPAEPVSIFKYVSAALYYSEDDTTWTDDIFKALGCGGNITWGSEYYNVKFSGYTCSLGGNIAMNFYVELSEDLLNHPDAFIKFTYGDKTVTVTVPLSEGREDVKNGVVRYAYSCPITSKNMADTITAQVCIDGAKIGDSKHMSVKTYCEYFIRVSNDKKVLNLMKAMLNYGASAQMLFNHGTDNLANAALSYEDTALTAVDASAYAHSRTGEEPGIKAKSYTLMLDSETTIRVYFTLDGTKSIDQYTFQVDGVTVTPRKSDKGWYIECPDIKAQELDEMHTFTCGGITITYGGMSYVNQVMTYYTSGTTFDMACALYAYWQAAETYIA